MELKEIVAALKELDVESEVISAIKALDQSDEVGKLTKELEAEKGKHAGILDAKNKVKDKLAAAEKSLKEIEDGKLSVEERVKNQVEELNQKLADAETARVQQENDFKAAQRETALSDITGSIKWSSAIPSDTAKLLVKDYFKDVEVLDKTIVDGKVKELVEVHKAFISADAPGGSGSLTGGNAGGGGSDEPATMKTLMKEIWQDK